MLHLFLFFNVQEHTVEFLTRLLSPPVPADYSGAESHLIGYACMLNVVIFGIGSVDSIQIFSLHGMVSKLCFMFYLELIYNMCF